MEIIGWIGSICFAISALPQAILSYKQGHADGVSWGTLLLWYTGELCTLIYVLPMKSAPLLFNYIGNLILISIVIRYKIWKRED